MPDATDPNVDGVEPSIAVRLLNDVSNPFSVLLDSGRKLFKDGEIVKVTENELAKLGAFAVEVVNDVESDVEDEVTKIIETDAPIETAVQVKSETKSAGVFPPVSTPGQSG